MQFALTAFYLLSLGISLPEIARANSPCGRALYSALTSLTQQTAYRTNAAVTEVHPKLLSDLLDAGLFQRALFEHIIETSGNKPGFISAFDSGNQYLKQTLEFVEAYRIKNSEAQRIETNIALLARIRQIAAKRNVQVESGSDREIAQAVGLLLKDPQTITAQKLKQWKNNGHFPKTSNWGLRYQRALESHLKSDSVTREQVVALGNQTDEHTFSLLAQHAQNGTTEVRLWVIEGLKNRKESEAIAVYKILLKSSSDLEVLLPTAEALARLGQREGLELLKLRQLVQDKNPDIRLRAIASLEKRGDPAAMALLKMMSHDHDPGVQMKVARALGRIGGREAFGVLLEISHAPNWRVRAEVAVALGEVGSPEAFAVLLNMSKSYDGDWLVRANVAHSLGAIGTPEAFAVLRTMCRDREPNVRAHVVSIFGKGRSPDMINVLSTMAVDSNRYVRIEVVKALENMSSPEAVTILHKMSHDNDWTVLSNAARALEKIDTPEARAALRDNAHSNNEDVRRLAENAGRRIRERFRESGTTTPSKR